MQAANESLAFVGTYTKKSKGIYAYRWNAADGRLTEIGLAAETTNPSFLAIHSNRKYLYAIGEISGGGKKGAITAFAIDAANGKLTQLNQQNTGGPGPCHVAVDQRGLCVVAANYGGGSVVSLPIKADGTLGEAVSFFQHEGSSVNKQRQSGPHAHACNLSPDNRFVFVCDLGLDKIMCYQLDSATAKLTPNDPPFTTAEPGAGPRHLAFHPTGKFAYVINELGNTMTAFEYDAPHGSLKAIQSLSTLPAGFTNKSSCAEVEVHPSGKFVYGSNRGHDSIVVYAVDQNNGKLTLVEHQSTQGRAPRFFGLDPSGQWLLAANQDTDNIVVFRVDTATGKLTPTGQNIQVGAPVCIKFLPVR